MKNRKKSFQFKKIPIFIFIFIITTSVITFSEQIFIPVGTNKSVKGGSNFTGTARIDMLYGATKERPVSAGYVTFEPGARTDWHTHNKGQQLIVTSGIGFTQEWGGKLQVIKPGDVIICPPNVKHWHGASPDTAMTHLAITNYDENGEAVRWLEKVTNNQYLGK